MTGGAPRANISRMNSDYTHADTCIRTASGRIVDLVAPHPENLLLADIAAGLSRIERFCGHCPLHPTVAQHSLAVEYIAGELYRHSRPTCGGPGYCGCFADDCLQKAPVGLLRAALMHDAQEAYGISDVGSPAKRAMRAGMDPDYRSDYDFLELGITWAIRERFGMATPSVEQYRFIDEADKIAYVYESQYRDWGERDVCLDRRAMMAFYGEIGAARRRPNDGGEAAFLARAAELGLT